MKYISFLGCFFLVACAGMAANNQINQAAQREQAAWKVAESENKRVCPHSPSKPLPRLEAMKQYDCLSGLIEKYVRPVAFNNDALNAYIIEMHKTYVAYKKGTIDRDEGKIRQQEAWARYSANLNQTAQGIMASAQQRDQATAQRMQQFSEQQNAMEIERMRSIQANRPVNTQCRMIANTYNCNTW